MDDDLGSLLNYAELLLCLWANVGLPPRLEGVEVACKDAACAIIYPATAPVQRIEAVTLRRRENSVQVYEVLP